jgi:hypothetical protein
MCDGMCNDPEEFCSQVWWIYIECCEYSGTSIYGVEGIYSEDEVNICGTSETSVSVTFYKKETFNLQQSLPNISLFLKNLEFLWWCEDSGVSGTVTRWDSA